MINRFLQPIGNAVLFDFGDIVPAMEKNSDQERWAEAVETQTIERIKEVFEVTRDKRASWQMRSH